MAAGQKEDRRYLRGYSPSRVALALALPLPAALVQWLLFPYISPSVWILFYPVLFLSSWLAGFIGGVGSAFVSTALVYIIFIGPESDWAIGLNRIVPTVLFIAMGVLFGEVHERLARVQAQLAEERDATEAKFEGLIGQSLAGIYIAENGLIAYANPEFARIFGYDSAESLIGLPSTELVTADFGGGSDRARRKESVSPGGMRSEVLGLRQDGSVVGIDVHGRTVEVDGRHMTIGIVIDRTEMLEARDTIRQRDEMLNRTSEIAKIGGWEMNALTGEISLTAEIVHIHDLDPDAGMVGRPYDYILPEWQPLMREASQRALQDGVPFDIEVEIVSAKGVHKWLRTAGRPVRLGTQIVSIQGTLQDVTERHEAEDALRRSEERYRMLVEQMPDGMIVVDAEGRIVDVNPTAAEMMGYTADEMCGQSASQMLRPEDAERAAQEIALADEFPGTSEWVLRRKNGSEFHAEIVGRRQLDGLVQVIVRDVTERRTAEKLIRELNSNLERKVALRTAEVVAANRELEAFSYAVSHDLRAPLRAMSGFCKALEEDYGDWLDDTARDYIGYIVEGSRSMSELIDALLTLSRDTRGDLLHESVDITALASKVIEQRRQLYPDRDVLVEIEPGMHVFGDARMVRVMISNLVGNAWKYTMKTESARVSVTSSTDSAGRQWIRVTDNGAGFDTRYAGQLFEPFHRLHRDDDFPGIGIGLATVKRIVNRHGGEIRAESAPGEGATFSFWLPGADELAEHGIAHGDVMPDVAGPGQES